MAGWLTGHVPGAVRDTVASAYNTMMERVTHLLCHTLENLAKFQREGSGWRLHSITKLVIQVTRYEPLAENKYMTPPPRRLIGKRAIANMKNDDNECFKWAVTRALHPCVKKFSKNYQRISTTK